MKVSPWLFLLLLAAFVYPVSAQESGMAVGNVKILEISGTPAQVSKGDGSSSLAKAGEFIQQGFTIKTAAGSTVTLLMDNGAVVVIQPETEFSIDQFITRPFDYEGVNYKTMTNEPSRSVTKLNVRSGDIFLNVVRLDKESKFDIVTPLGSAGIRGTSLSVGSSGIVVAAGLVQAFSAAGQSQMLGANTGVGFAPTGFSAISQQAISAMIQAIISSIQQLRPTLPANPFAGAPPQAPANGGTGDETSDTGDQGTINQGQTLPGSGNRPPLPSN
jgi:hypothetical protein